MGFNRINRVVILSICLVSSVSTLQPEADTPSTTLEESKTFSKTSLRSFGTSPIIESRNVTNDSDSGVDGEGEVEKGSDSDHGVDNEVTDSANGNFIRENSDEDDDVDSEGYSSVDDDLTNDYRNDDEYDDDSSEEVDDHPDDEEDEEDDDDEVDEDDDDEDEEEEDTTPTLPPTTTNTPGQHHLITDRENASIQIGNDGKVYMFVAVNENYDPNVGYLDLDNNTKLLINIGDDDDEGEDENKLSSENSDTEDQSGNSKVLPVMVAEGSNIRGDGSLVLLDNGGESGNKEVDREAKKSKNANNMEVHNILPEFPDDTQFSVGWSAATLSYDDLKNLLERNDDDDLSIISTTTSSDDLSSSSSYSSAASSVTYYYTTEGSENDFEDETGDEDDPNKMSSMTDEELKDFLKKYKDLIETGEDYEADTDPEEPMTLFAEGSESDSARSLVKGEGETMTQNDGDDETKLGNVNEGETMKENASEGETETKNTSKSDQHPYLDRIFQEMMKDDNLTEEEKSYLRDLERIRKLARSLGGIEALKNDSVTHHIVRRQLRGTEACGSFSKRRRRSLETPSDLPPQENNKKLKSSHLNIIRFPPRTNTLNDILLQAKTNSHPSHYKSTNHRSKRGISNVGRRLEMGNPGFRQLYNQYKHMCNFIAMVAFEK